MRRGPLAIPVCAAAEMPAAHATHSDKIHMKILKIDPCLHLI
jgi:hypothetical protein